MKKLFTSFSIGIVVILVLVSCRNENTVESLPLLGDNPTVNYNLTTIIAPEYQDRFSPGDEIKIEWEADPKIQSISLFLYRKSEHRDVIARDIGNSGSFVWKIPENLPQSHHYRIKIQDSDIINYSTLSKDFFILE
ncbi:MAG: GPI anchored serine-threonine rich family protein [Melioribacteraceae bacterium]|nr:GPI anchored serine-threonine rich family protein [Melioribacteraceae bacterium]MCF8265273.1 GPI anchored serine-threonine rich family protein [Melioribacteraceae bacterium]MCF8413266.1 GPI anchored serine-threonine rich family protein [Melioribacteraceae bacterium]MCF8431735.1 GPI anchored serine-threonine rich family protein [Melioribacteraceae bacterium]